MIERLKNFWNNVGSSLWFVPALMTLASVGLAIAFVEADSHINREILAEYPRFFGSSAGGARSILSSIAGSMITVAGVTFSITVVALSLASNQYTPRVLRNFMADRGNQVVLGIFVSIFVYCLVVLRTIRGGEESFVPSVSVLFAIVLAVIGVGFLIYFVHHVASLIQASGIISSIAAETITAIGSLFPEEMGEDEENEAGVDESKQSQEDKQWNAIPAKRSGYIQSLDEKSLLKFASDRNTMLRMERGIGEFVIKGTPLISIMTDDEPEKKTVRAINNLFTILNYRTIRQDADFGIRQLVDIALKALSPGINDTTTAVTCVDYLGAILNFVAGRRLPARYRYENGQLRVIARGPTFDSLANEAINQIRQSAEGNVTVLVRLLQQIETIGRHTPNASRRRRLRHHAELIAEVADQTISYAHDRRVVNDALDCLARALDPQSPDRILIPATRNAKQ